MSMKNPNDTIWNRTSDLPICSTAHVCMYVCIYVRMYVYMYACMIVPIDDRITAFLFVTSCETFPENLLTSLPQLL